MRLSFPFSELVADSDERALPLLTRRNVALPWVPGKADAVIGMRRSGKTSLLFQKMGELVAAGWPRESLLYASFDDERLDGLEARDLGGLVDAFYARAPQLRDRECALFLDEIQVVPGWERFARRLLDSENVHVCLSGSSAKLLSREIATSMRGRALTTEVFPFDFTEMLRHAHVDPSGALGREPGKKTRSVLEHWMSRFLATGGFPEVQGLDEDLRVRVLRDYVDVAILRDVIERHGISNPTALRRVTRQLLHAPATQVSAHRLYNDLRSQGITVSKDSVHAFLDHLTDAYLVQAIEIFSDSDRVRQSNPRKFYPVDQGLVTAFARRADPSRGPLFETFVYLTLRHRHEPVAYYRTREGFEVDFVVPRGGSYILVQACAELGGVETKAREVRALESAMRELGVQEGTIVTAGESGEEKVSGGTVRIVPAWRWALGA